MVNEIIFNFVNDRIYCFSAKYENVELPGYEQPAVYKEDLIVNIFLISYLISLN